MTTTPAALTADLMRDLVEHLDDNGESFVAIGLAATIALHNSKGLTLTVDDVAEDEGALAALEELTGGGYVLEHDDGQLIVHPDEVEALTETYDAA